MSFSGLEPLLKHWNRHKPTARIKLCDCLTEPAPAPSSWAWGPPAPAPATPSRRTWGRCSGWISTGAEMRVWAPMILSNYKCKSRVFLLPVALNSEPAGTGKLWPDRAISFLTCCCHLPWRWRGAWSHAEMRDRVWRDEVCKCLGWWSVLAVPVRQ